MSQPSQESTPKPMTVTLTIPRPLAAYWRSVEAGRLQPVAVAFITAWFAMLVATPWLWGFTQIVTSILESR
jgi:hypothetical protein